MEAPVAECWNRTGRPPITTRWADLDRGTAASPDVRCRLVERDFKVKGKKDRFDLFAAMPPLEAEKALLRHAGLERRYERQDGATQKLQLLFIDAKKAHLNGVVGEDEHVYVDLPEEAGVKKGLCGRLKRWLYDMRPGSNACEREYLEKFVGEGFFRGGGTKTSSAIPLGN